MASSFVIFEGEGDKGDGANDIPLLSSVGLAIVMDNALDKVKAVADYVTLDVDHSGLAAAIERFLL